MNWRSASVTRIVIAFVLTGLLVSCGSSSGLTTFPPLANGYNLYFIRPLQLSCSTGSGSIDITYNTTPGKDVIVNFNLNFVADNLVGLHSCAFMTNVDSIGAKSIQVRKMFCENSECRFTSTFSQQDFLVFMRGIKQQTGTIHFACNGGSWIKDFEIESSFQKTTRELLQNIE